MKIAMVIPSLVDEGGGERQFLYLARELKKRDHRVSIYTFDYAPQNCYPEITRGLDIRSLHKNRFRPRGKGIFPTRRIYWSYLRLYPELRKLAHLMEDDYDIVNCHAEGLHWLAPLVRKKARKIIWMCNDIPASIEFSQRSSLGIQGMRRIKFYLDKFFVSTLLTFLDRIAMRHIDAVIALSNRVKDIISRAYRREVVVVRSGVDIDYFSNKDTEKAQSIRQRYGVGIHDFLLFSLSLLQPIRRLEDLICAVEILIKKGVELKLALAGDLNYNVNYSSYLRRLVQEKELTSLVLFIGKVSEAELSAHYQAGDLFVFPSDERQTWGLVVFEAMASHRPVVVSKACGASEVLEDGNTAYLFPARCPEILAQKIEIVIKNTQKAREIAEKGYEYTKTNFSWEKYAAAMEKIFADRLTFIPA